MDEQGYLPKVQAIFTRMGWTRGISPAGLLGDWGQFVEWCTRGYSDNIYEYENDIRVREWIELILSSSDLQNFTEHTEFASNVASVDEKFRRLLVPDKLVPGKTLWWEQGVLKYAGAELANDFEQRYGLPMIVMGA